MGYHVPSSGNFDLEEVEQKTNINDNHWSDEERTTGHKLKQVPDIGQLMRLTKTQSLRLSQYVASQSSGYKRGMIIFVTFITKKYIHTQR